LIEGDYRIRQAMMSGELAALGRHAKEPWSVEPREMVPG
jgi:hypothetical protein